jgi:hypothetical protein
VLDAGDSDGGAVVLRQWRGHVVARIEVDVVGGLDEDLLHLVGGERIGRPRAVVARLVRQNAAVDGIKRRRNDKHSDTAAIHVSFRRKASSDSVVRTLPIAESA